MFSPENRAPIVVGIILVSAIFALAGNSLEDKDITIGGQTYQVIDVRKEDPKFGVVEKGGLFQHVSEPAKYQIKVAANNSVKWIDVDEPAYSVAVNKLKSLGY